MEEYFLVPPFIFGFLWEENIILLTKAEYRFIEKTLYPDAVTVCEVQGKVSEYLFFDPLTSVEAIIAAQKQLFANFGKLPDSLQIRLQESILAQYKRFCDEHGIGIYKVPAEFHALLRKFHEAMWNIAKSKICYTSKN